MRAYTVNRRNFSVPTRYEVLEADGFGAYGDAIRVVSRIEKNAPLSPTKKQAAPAGAIDSPSALNSSFAASLHRPSRYIIRKFASVLDLPEAFYAITRMLLLQRSLSACHGVLPLVETYRDRHTPSDIYCVFPSMECTLQDAIYSQTAMTISQIWTITMELALCLRQLHANGIVLGELQPAWIGVQTHLSDRGCIAINNFSACHAVGEPLSTVATQPTDLLWYRAPEWSLNGVATLSPAADVWSLGCLIAEMIREVPLFQCGSYLQHVSVISDLIGSPQDIPTFYTNDVVVKWISSLPSKLPISLASIFKGTDLRMVQLLKRIFVWNPSQRITAEEIVQHLNTTNAKIPPVLQIQTAKWKEVKHGSPTDVLLDALKDCVPLL